MEIELHPLCTLFPTIDRDCLGKISAFSGTRSDGLCIATFVASDKYPGHWDFSFFDVKTAQHNESRMPIASRGLPILLDQFGGSDNWVLNPCSSEKPAHVSIKSNLDRLPSCKEIVYFLRAGDFIKIGKATGSPKARIATLQTGCPFPIVAIGYISGGIAEEFALHKRFEKFHAHGEWFHATPQLIEAIEEIWVAA